jgi:KipI family sensor histidine kinase inhibitor
MLPATIHPAGDAAVLIRLGSAVDRDLNGRVLELAKRLRIELAGIPDLEVIPAYASILVSGRTGAVSVPELQERVQPVLRAPLAPSSPSGRTFLVPVAYGEAYGVDLQDVAAYHGMSAEEVVERHSAGVYRVYAVGFSPGFPYLGGLDPLLSTPRLASPRPRVPAGSVAIGGEQTGIYPTPTPGGWRLIGRSPLSLFDPRRSPPVDHAPGDFFRFIPVGAAEYERLHALGLSPAEYTATVSRP